MQIMCGDWKNLRGCSIQSDPLPSVTLAHHVRCVVFFYCPPLWEQSQRGLLARLLLRYPSFRQQLCLLADSEDLKGSLDFGLRQQAIYRQLAHGGNVHLSVRNEGNVELCRDIEGVSRTGC